MARQSRAPLNLISKSSSALCSTLTWAPFLADWRRRCAISG
jgi:purine-cytosine permease-like protein